MKNNELINNNKAAKPFLRWAGGKSWLLKHLPGFLPKDGFNSYHEPFLGGGSIFFNLNPQNGAFLSDLNLELINTYIEVQRNVEGVINKLKEFENTKEFYYEVRDARHFKSRTSKAARFIYLNQTSFNGIYRENLNGKYNVPYGFRRKQFLDPENLRLASSVLQNATITDGDFFDVIKRVKKQDLVFLDPPYTVTHYENGFIKYNSKLFNENDQTRLSNAIDCLKELGAYYILTNAAHIHIRELFCKSSDRIIELQRASLIGGKSAKRGKYSELIITNIPY